MCRGISRALLRLIPQFFSLQPFWFKEFLDHRDPHLLGPPRRPIFILLSKSAPSPYLTSQRPGAVLPAKPSEQSEVRARK